MSDRHWGALVSEARDWAAIGQDNLRRKATARARENFVSIETLLTDALTQVPAVEPAPDPEPDPQPAPGYPDVQGYLRGFAAPQHWNGDARCVDWYAAPLGTWFGWPLAGEVRRLSTSGPMGTSLVSALLYVTGGPWSDWAFLFTHVLDTIRTGYREAHEPFAQLGNSGIEMLPDAAHIHLAVDAPGGVSFTPDGAGDVGAWDALQALGFEIEPVARVPSPSDYLQGRARGGHFV